MKRLKYGALAAKLPTLLLVSLLIQGTCPTFGQVQQASGNANTPSPADLSASGSAGSTPHPLLKYTPASKASAGAPAPLAVASNSPAGTSTGASPRSNGSPIADAGNAPVPIAQAPQRTGFAPAAASRSLPISVGTVQVRKPFKVFVREELIRNLSFRDTPVREVISELARRGNLNIVIDRSVGGSVTGELKDVTLNEAMDGVLAAAGLTSRILDNNTVVVGSPAAMIRMGLNRTSGRAFKLSYAHPYDVANLLYAGVFNRGMLPDFSAVNNRQSVNTDRSERRSESQELSSGSAQGGEGRAQQTTSKSSSAGVTGHDISSSDQTRETTRPDSARMVRGSSRAQVQEGVGYNNAATDPGSQQIRTDREIITDYAVEQNGGGAIVIPDAVNRQVIVIGTPDDIKLAEEAIRLIDRRPRMVHIQASLIELDNNAIRQIGANIGLQGAGASTTLLGNVAAPLVSLLPGLGGAPPTVTSSFSNNISIAQPGSVFSASSTITNAVAQGALVAPATPFAGVLGSFLPASVTPPSIGGVSATTPAASGFNFLTLSKRAGGNANIATFPAGLNVSLNLLLQTNKSKILANPSVIVADNTEALITIANEVLHKVTSTVSLGVVSTNIELTKAGIFLNVLPKVTEDGFIVMRMRPQVSAPFGSPIILANNTVEVQLLSIREIMAQEVRIKDGQTLVIGGLFTENEASNIAKVPYLAETPILGALFRNTLKGRSRSELLLLLTPKVVEEEPIPISTPGGPSPTM